MQEKLKIMLKSRRFWAVVSGLIMIISKELELTTMSESQIQDIVMLIASWILGESLRSSNGDGNSLHSVQPVVPVDKPVTPKQPDVISK